VTFLAITSFGSSLVSALASLPESLLVSPLVVTTSASVPLLVATVVFSGSLMMVRWSD